MQEERSEGHSGRGESRGCCGGPGPMEGSSLTGESRFGGEVSVRPWPADSGTPCPLAGQLMAPAQQRSVHARNRRRSQAPAAGWALILAVGPRGEAAAVARETALRSGAWRAWCWGAVSCRPCRALGRPPGLCSFWAEIPAPEGNAGLPSRPCTPLLSSWAFGSSAECSVSPPDHGSLRLPTFLLAWKLHSAVCV